MLAASLAGTLRDSCGTQAKQHLPECALTRRGRLVPLGGGSMGRASFVCRALEGTLWEFFSEQGTLQEILKVPLSLLVLTFISILLAAALAGTLRNTGEMAPLTNMSI